MVTAEKTSLAEQLLKLRTVEEVEEIIASFPEAEWRPLGGRELNYPTVHLSADPGDALVERITNAADALIERWMECKGITALSSPREAVETLFSFPNGRLLNVSDRRTPAERVQVTLRDSGESKRPTVVVQDAGIGQHPDDFETTLLSLNQSNKRTRFELLGAFGQGGAAVFAFTPYSVFVSRRDPELLKPGQQELVGWTIVRLNELDENAKYGQYEYLVVPNSQGELQIPRMQSDELPAEYQDFTGCYFAAVRYQLDRYSDSVFQPKASLWYLFNTILFDPVYPVLIRDERPKAVRSNAKNAHDGIVVMGNAVRLTEDKRKTVEYDNTHLINLGDDGTVVLRYWLIKEGDDPKATWERMANYISPEYAVTITLNGQRQGQMRRETFNKLGLMTTGKCLIVQVDCDGLTKRAKRELFTSTRDRINSSSPLAGRLENEIRAALGLDAQLRALERVRKERALRRQSEAETKKINELLKKEIATLRQGDQPVFKKVISTNSEFQLLGDQPLLDESGSDPGGERPEPFELTEPPPVPTSVHVMSRSVRVPVGGTGVVRLSMDAPDDYISPEPGMGTGNITAAFTKGSNVFHLTGYSAVRRGVLRVTISAEKGVPPGETGRVIFAITRPDDLPLLAEAELNAVEAPQARAKPAGTRPGPEPGPNVHGITLESWQQDLGLSDNVVTSVEEDPETGTVTIYVLKEYAPLVSRLKREANDEETMHAYQAKFVAAMGLAAWLQYEDQKDAAEEATPEILQAEIRRAARIFLFSQQIAMEKFTE